MTKSSKTIHKLVSILAIISTIYLIYIMLALVINKEQVFIEREIISISENIIGIGFLLILLFNIVSFFWLLRKFRNSDKVTIGKKITLTLCGFCLLLLIGDKTMIDEIGREYSLGWETLGEWIILYVFLAIQLLYNFIFLIISKNIPYNSKYST